MTHFECKTIERVTKIYRATEIALLRVLEFSAFLTNNPNAHIEITIKSGAYDKDIGDNELQGFLPILEDFLSARKQKIESEMRQLSILTPQQPDDEIPF